MISFMFYRWQQENEFRGGQRSESELMQENNISKHTPNLTKDFFRSKKVLD